MKFPREIYAIQHNHTKKIYVGSSCNVKDRYLNHMYLLMANKHKNDDMQADFNLYGEDFSVFILDEIHDITEKKKEYEWMKKLNSHIRECGYNYMDNVMKKKKETSLPIKNGLPTPLKMPT